MCVTGGALEEVAQFIKRNLKGAQVTDAIVFYDYGREDAKERLQKNGIELHPILDQTTLGIQYVRASLIAQNNHLVEDLANKFQKGHISYENFLKRTTKSIAKD